MKDFSRRISGLSQKRLVLLATQLRSQLDQLQRSAGEPIAIIGMGCRFPGGANDPDAYWQLLHDGVDAISEIPKQRWDVDAYYDEDVHAPGKIFTRWAGLMERIDEFDAPFFGIAPREALTMDPQQRVLLETAWEALERAGLRADQLDGSKTGVFIGISGSDYYHLQLSGGVSNIDAYFASGNAHSVASGRLSYILGLRGPCLSVDTACSSSLVAVHLAVQSLRHLECHTALAGGVNMIMSPEITIALSKAEMMAADGRCKAFDARADGFVRGEGCGVLVLKRLTDAVRDGDRVLALIRGSAINQDGKSNGLTAPNGPSQEAVIRQALDNADVGPEEIGYIEAHGTGTSLGDPIEARALGTVFGRHRSKADPLWVGSVKTNIGHLESAAGIAGLIKIVLALQHEEIPPHLHLERPNPHIDWDHLPISIPTAAVPWPAGAGSRKAGLSSFGFSGTNAHVVLEEAPAAAAAIAAVDRPNHLLTLSAMSSDALRAQAGQYAAFLASASDDMAAICFSANTGRTPFKHRLAVVADSKEQVRRDLQSFVEGTPASRLSQGSSRRQRGAELAFLFTGQGAQYVGMGKALYHTQPAFRQTIDECDQWLTPLLGLSLLSVLGYSNGVPEETGSLLDQTRYTQPVLFSLEVALAQLWRSWGVEPTVVMGHSLGEYVAACVAGVFTLQDGLTLVSERARMMQALPESGGMLAIFTDTPRVEEMLAPYQGRIGVAAFNGPANTVVSGPKADIAAFEEQLGAGGVRCTRLAVSHAFHSALMEPMLDGFEKVISGITFRPPQMGLVSNVTGELAGPEELSEPDYWRRHTRQAVRFEDSMRTLRDQLGCSVFIEVGPHPVLTGMAAPMFPSDGLLWLPSLRRGHDDWPRLLQSLADLYVYGYDVDWKGFDKHWTRSKVVLPTYPFERKRYWVDPGPAPSAPPAPSDPEAWRDWLYQYDWELKPLENPEIQVPDHLHETRDAKTAWLVLADKTGLGDRLAGMLRDNGITALVAKKGDGFQRIDATTFALDPTDPEPFRRLLGEIGRQEEKTIQKVIHMWAIDEWLQPDDPTADLEPLQQRVCGSVLHLSQAMATVDPPPHLVLLTMGAQAVASEDKLAGFAQAPLWGLGRVIALEHPEFGCIRIDLDPRTEDGGIPALFEALISDGSQERQLALRGDQWFVLRLGKSPAGQIPGKDPSNDPSYGKTARLRPDASYLITGGLAGIGIEAGRWLVAQGARHLILMGRSAPSTEAQEVIAMMEDQGAEVTVIQQDVAEYAALEAVFHRLARQGRQIKGILHCAGTLDDGILLQQNWERFSKVLRAKVDGSWNLHLLSKGLDLDIFVLFSSGAAFFGSSGQGNHATANAFMDGLAHYRRANGQPAISINWGAWSQIGVATKGGVIQRIQMKGMAPIQPDQGFHVLGQLLDADPVQTAVLPIYWPEFFRAIGDGGERRIFERFEEKKKTGKSAAIPAPSDFLEQLRRSTPARWQKLLRQRVQQEVCKCLGFESAQPIDSHQPLIELGLDSLMAVELRNAISLLVDSPLPATLLFNYPSVAELVGHLSDVVLPSKLHGHEPPADAAATGQGAIEADDLENYSEEEMERLLLEKLKNP